jgi:predicted metal-binding membrane protein
VIALARDRTTVTAAAGIGAATAAAWLGLSALQEPMGLAAFLVAWTTMMVAMMLPSIAPLVLLYRGSRARLALGYILVWGALGVVPWMLMEGGFDPALPLVLALAGAYELTPLKTACLQRCRHAADFLIARYRSGPVRLGAEHASWCVGCCVGLMAVLVLAAAMELRWAALLAAVVFLQKAMPLGEISARATGVLLVLLGFGIMVA